MTKLIIVSVVFLVALILISLNYAAHARRDVNGGFGDKDVQVFARMMLGNACLAGFITGLIVSNIVIG
jgi:hypothetical protein